MSRNVKRVPLDFDWPLKARWHGYLMPDNLREVECGDCGGSGCTPAGQHVNAVSEVLLDLTEASIAKRIGREAPRVRHRLRSDHIKSSTPGSDIEDFVAKLMGVEGPGGPGAYYGHYDAWKMTAALLNHAGLDEDWAECKTCKGMGIVEAWEGQEEAANAWASTEPPKGEGWQMWESTTEGSPISPVFDSAEGLIDWLVESGASLSGSVKATHEEWAAIVHGTGDVWITLSGGNGPSVNIIEHEPKKR